MHAENKVEIYQIHIWINYISPMVWRRLLVRSDTTIADLHYYIQIIMGWEDEHLHQFIIRKGSYGIWFEGGMSFDDDPDKILLRDFDFYNNEKFKYEYNFHIPWEHKIRLEKRVPLHVKKTYPICISGENLGPTEDCISIEEFIQSRGTTSRAELDRLLKINELLKEYLEGVLNVDGKQLSKEKLREILDDLKTLQIARDDFNFNRKTINRKLQEYTSNRAKELNFLGV